jgi:hypothetical protein
VSGVIGCPIKSIKRPPWRHPNVGSAVGTLKTMCGIKPRRKEMKSNIMARRTGRSMLANADRGDFGDKMLT